jgi:hypothetical protein
VAIAVESLNGRRGTVARLPPAPEDAQILRGNTKTSRQNVRGPAGHTLRTAPREGTDSQVTARVEPEFGWPLRQSRSVICLEGLAKRLGVRSAVLFVCAPSGAPMMPEGRP